MRWGRIVTLTRCEACPPSATMRQKSDGPDSLLVQTRYCPENSDDGQLLLCRVAMAVGWMRRFRLLKVLRWLFVWGPSGQAAHLFNPYELETNFQRAVVLIIPIRLASRVMSFLGTHHDIMDVK